MRKDARHARRGDPARPGTVWIRPDGGHELVLQGGLRKKDLHTLRERGFAPAVVVETGP